MHVCVRQAEGELRAVVMQCCGCVCVREAELYTHRQTCALKPSHLYIHTYTRRLGGSAVVVPVVHPEGEEGEEHRGRGGELVLAAALPVGGLHHQQALLLWWKWGDIYK